MIDFALFEKEETKQFIRDNLKSDIQKLLLNPPKEFKDSIKKVSSQIQARQKARGKLDSWHANFDLIFPPPLSVEQASSEQTADYKKAIIKGKHLIDLSGGMGIDCLALSENFQQTTYVEMRVEIANAFAHNSKVLGKQIAVYNRNAADFLDQHSEREVTFYLDPARRDDAQNKVFKLEDCSPNLLEILPTLRKFSDQVLVKLSPLFDIKSLLQKIPEIKELHVVSVKNDCKELLALIDFSFEGETEIKTVNLGSADPVFNFTYQQEEGASPLYDPASKFLLEPNASILKAGAFKLPTTKFGLSKLHPNTHLYTSDKIPEDWPGRVFEILEDQPDKKKIKKYAPEGFINVLTRNYPLTAKELKKKHRVQDGGELYLIGFRDNQEKAKLVIARKVEAE